MTSQFPTLLDIRAALPNRQDVPGLGDCTSTPAIEAIFGRGTKVSTCKGRVDRI